MAYRMGTTMRNAAAAAIGGVFDQGSGAGKIKFYTGTQPGSVGGSYGTLLGTCVGSDPFFGSPSTGVITAASISSDTSADNSGTCQSAAFTDSADTVISDADAAQGSGTVNFDSNVIVAGGVIAVSSMTITVPIS